MQFDAWLRWSPTTQCNLHCVYCSNKAKGGLSTINVPALIETLDKTGLIFKINFLGGGEPLLVPNIIEVISELTKKHYVTFITNLTLKKPVRRICEIGPQKIPRMNVSIHMEELERTHLLGTFLENYQAIQEGQFSIYSSIVAYPGVADKIESYKKIFDKYKIEPEVIPFMGEYNGKIYPRDYNEEERECWKGLTGKDFCLKNEDLNVFGQYCNAGCNTAVIDQYGDVTPCKGVKKSLGNIYSGFQFEKKMTICPKKSCGCPVRNFDKTLFEKAMKECKV